jgi:hypothetical protein
MSSTREDRPRRRRLVGALLCGGVGLFSLYTGLNRPTISGMRTIDLMHLLATGAGLGAGLVLLVLSFRRAG